MDKRTPFAGGFAVALCTMIGSFWGLRTGQPSFGLLLGLAIGCTLAAIFWAIQRR